MTNTQPQNKAAIWFARIAILIVFAINVQCALVFMLFPESYIGAYELSGTAGIVALQGLGVAFLMWNATYPLVVVDPLKHRVLYIVVLTQQTIGLIGESMILFSIEEGHAILSASILRFIVFDGAGLILMGLAFIFLLRSQKKNKLSII